MSLLLKAPTAICREHRRSVPARARPAPTVAVPSSGLPRPASKPCSTLLAATPPMAKRPLEPWYRVLTAISTGSHRRVEIHRRVVPHPIATAALSSASRPPAKKQCCIPSAPVPTTVNNPVVPCFRPVTAISTALLDQVDHRMTAPCSNWSLEQTNRSSLHRRAKSPGSRLSDVSLRSAQIGTFVALFR